MSFRRRVRILASGKSPSVEALKRTYRRAWIAGGVMQDLTANIENIREISRKSGYDICYGKTVARRNQHNYSEDYTQSVWIKNLVNIIPNSIPAPFGTSSGSTFQQNGAASTFTRRISTNSVLNGPYTLSGYFKKKDFDGIGMGIFSGTGVGTGASFNIANGTITTVGPTNTADIINVGNGWYRCWVSGIVSATTRTDVLLADASGNNIFNDTNTFGNYVWGLQLEGGLQPTDYQFTTTAYTDLQPQATVLYVPSVYGEGRNYTENQNLRNLLQRTDQFDNATWVKQNTTISTNVILAPDGVLSADRLVESNTSSFKRVSQTVTVGNGMYDFSVYLKKGGRFKAAVNISDNVSGDVSLNVDLNNKTFSSGVSGVWSYVASDLLEVGDDWFRASITGIRTTGTTCVCYVYILADNGDIVYSGNGTSGIYVWGAQLEQTINPSLYQPQLTVGDGITDFVFTRATTSTTTNKLGLIEDSCYNLSPQSEVFDNAAWAKTNITITANVVSAPNGTFTADKIVSANGTAGVVSIPTYQFISGSTYTYSVYAKKEQFNYIGLSMTTGIFPPNNRIATFDLNNGIISPLSQSGTNAIITDAGNGWYRCSVTLTAISSGTGQYTFGDRSTNDPLVSSGNGVSGIYVWGAQFEVGSTPRPYLKTTNRLNVPKLDYSRSLSEPSLLIEPARTNLFQRSEELDNTYWSKGRVTISVNSTIAPSGILTADAMMETAVIGTHIIDVTTATVITSGQTYTRSVYAKSNGRQWLGLDLFQSSTDYLAIFDIINGTIGDVSPTITPVITNVGNGWFRCSITKQAVANTTAHGTFMNLDGTVSGSSYLGDVTKGIYLWGQQFELGSTPSTYITTTTATVTRNAETMYTDLLTNNRLPNANNYTAFFEGYLYDNSTSNIMFGLSSAVGTGTRVSDLGFYDGIRGTFCASSVVSGDSSTNLSGSSAFKVVVVRRGTSIKFFRNGSEIWNTTTAAVAYRYFVMNNGGSSYAIDKAVLLPRSLSDAECIALTI